MPGGVTPTTSEEGLNLTTGAGGRVPAAAPKEPPRMGRPLSVLVLVLLGCAVAAPAMSAGVRGGTLNIALGSDPPSLDPHKTPSADISHTLIYSTLVTVDRKTGEFIPSLADSWVLADGGKIITFKLHPGVKFHDGTLFTSQAVKATIDRLVNPGTAAPGASWIGPIDRVETPDEMTARLVFKEPYAPIFSSLRISFLAMLSPQAIAKLGKDYGQAPVGTGPFMFRQWIPGDRIVLERNPDYAWAPRFYQNRGAPYVDGVVLRVIPDESTRVIAFERGDLDILPQAPAREARRLQQTGRYQAFQRSDNGGLYLGLNVTRPIFSDARVRQALGYAINRDEIVRYALDRLAVPMDSPLAPTIWGYAKGLRNAYRYDPARAGALLREAGWTPGPDGVLQKDGRPFAFTAWTYPRDTNVRIAVVVQAQLKKVGIRMSIEQIEVATLLARTPKGEHDAILVGYGWPDADILYYFFHSSRMASTNRVHYANPEVDRLLDEGRVTVDPDRRLDVYRHLQEILLQQAPWIPLASPVVVTLAQPWVHDLYVDKFGTVLTNDAYIRK
jgi:peptide/nickel transport system substrate-binding protein